MTINIKRGDTDVNLAVNVDLTGATVKVFATPYDDPTGTQLSSSITNNAEGTVTAVTSALTAGRYRLEVEVNQGGKTYSFPNVGYETLIVTADLG